MVMNSEFNSCGFIAINMENMCKIAVLYRKVAHFKVIGNTVIFVYQNIECDTLTDDSLTVHNQLLCLKLGN